MIAVAFRICHTALKGQQVATGDVVFNVCDEAKRTFIIKGGELRYTYRNGAILKPPLKTKEWLAEAVLWTHWRYRGTLKGKSPSELLCVDGARFQEAMCVHPKPRAFGRCYGQKFVSFLNHQNPADWQDVFRNDEFYINAVHDSQLHSTFEEEPSSESPTSSKDHNNKCDLNGLDDREDEGEISPKSACATDMSVGAKHESVVPEERTITGRAPKSWASRSMCFTSVCFPPCAGQ